MRRSEINAIMREADAFFAQQGFPLPPFAHWSPGAWRGKGPEVAEIVDRRLGWDITDFGQGDWCRCGLVLFTIRNGSPEELERGRGKLYCEKLLMFRRDQGCPFHFHWLKMEDIINRGGGELAVQLYNSTPEEGLADTPVTVSVDGVRRTLDAGGELRLQPGESACLPPLCYHRIWARHHRVMAGEVSLVNDDDRDNRFLERVARFAAIDEDEPPLFLLRQDYGRYWPHFAAGRSG
ncbi:MAG: D-lyxose/D-mannose family sugar isomerase [Dongiaceae bacterium]